jgi:glutamate--cysteine ligase
MSNTWTAAVDTQTAPLAAGLAGLLPQRQAIEQWFIEQERKVTLLPYVSVDLRYAGHKLAPVDTNLFPAGFNNISSEDYPSAIAAFTHLRKTHQLPSTLLLLAESHSRNIHYWQNIAVIQRLMTESGFNIHVSAMLSGLPCPKTLSLPDAVQITLEPICIHAHQLTVNNIIPDGILLNRDMAEGVPAALNHIKQPFFPPLQMGWHRRRKSQHFHHYEHVAKQFAADFNIDSWQINALWHAVSPVDFSQDQSTTDLHHILTELFQAIETQHTHAQIHEPIFVMLKADAGTYGQAIIAIHHPDDILHLNQAARRTMLTTKGKQPVNAIIAQEGVYSQEFIRMETQKNTASAEPVIYLVGNRIVGGFYRAHANKSNNDNLNRPGMFFQSFPIATILQHPDMPDFARCYLYSVVARLAGLAAGYETQEYAKL